ncbi:TPA: hypothetical protein EYP66_21410 [Candidatus Poribacteria bacterium]|nr:hypothetical protein [Candidatus Poribacteria bacterium]
MRPMYLNYQYTTPTEEKQRDLQRHQFLKNRHFYFFKAKPIKLLNKYTRWRKVAELMKLSSRTKNRLEWIIYYETKAQKNASFTARHFGISRKTFYKWYHRFQNGNNYRGLEDEDKTPKHVRTWEVTPTEEQRIITLKKQYIRTLKKQYIRWGKKKIALLYQQEYEQDISSWKVQRVIEKHKLYYHPQKTAKIRRKRQRAQSKKRLTELHKKRYPSFLICLDVIVVYWNGLKRYIFTAIDYVSKLAFARMYQTKSSYNGQDFLRRLHYLLDGKIFNAGHDNGSEFEKLFKQECQRLNIPQWYSRPRTPKDNPVNEKFNQTLKQEFLELANFTPEINLFNQQLTEWLIVYNFKRPHQALNYQTPIQFTEKTLKVLPMWSSSASN